MTMPAQTWCCLQCGSTEIAHDELVFYNPDTKTHEVLGLLDCMQCGAWRSVGVNTPSSGVPGEDEEEA